MADTVDTRRLLLQVDASVELLRRKLDEGGGRLDRFGRDAQRVLDRFDGRLARTGARGMPELERSLGGVSRALNAARAGFVGLIASQTVGRITALTDTAKQLDAQLRLATQSTGSFGQAQEDVRRIADATRSGLAETAQLYATFQRNAQELGISQTQAARATETVTKAFQISGASAAEAAGGLRQFLQGIRSGTLRGEELNSVLENAPRLAQLLADSLGVTIGELRKLGEEGQLSGDKLINALTNRSFTAGIDAEFSQLPVPIDQALTQVQNTAVDVFGAFDRGGEFSSYIATFISDGASGFSSLGDEAEDLGGTIRATFETLGDVFDPLLDGARAVFGEIDLSIATMRNDIAEFFGVLDSVNSFGNRVLGTAATSWEQRFRDNSRRRDAANSDRNLRDVLSSGTSRLFEQQGLNNDGTPRRPPAPRASSSSGGGGRRRTRSSAGTSAAERAAQREEERFQDRLREIYRGVLADDLSEAIAAGARRAEEQFGRIFPTADDEFDTLSREADRRAQVMTEAELAEIETARQARDDAIASSAELFETLFLDGTKGLWQQFRFEGLRAVATVLAALVQGQSLSSALGGLSSGGSIFSGLGRLFGSTPKAASGGRVVGPGTGRSDSILARVSNGEFIVNARATSENRQLLEQINTGRLPSFAGGGYVAPRIAPGSLRSFAPQPAVIQLAVDEGAMFVPRVQQISGEVSVQVVDRNNSAVARARRREIPQ